MVLSNIYDLKHSVAGIHHKTNITWNAFKYQIIAFLLTVVSSTHSARRRAFVTRFGDKKGGPEPGPPKAYLEKKRLLLFAVRPELNEVGPHVLLVLVVGQALEDHLGARDLRLWVLDELLESRLVPSNA